MLFILVRQNPSCSAVLEQALLMLMGKRSKQKRPVRLPLARTCLLSSLAPNAVRNTGPNVFHYYEECSS